MKKRPGYPQGLFVFLLSLPLFISGIVAGCDTGGGATTDPDGTVNAAAFSRSFGGPSKDSADLAVATADGGYAYVGETVDDNGIPSVQFVKLDANGETEWAREFAERNVLDSGQRGLLLKAIAVAADDGYCLTGSVSGAGGDLSDIYVARLDSAGQLLWDVSFDSGGWAGYTVVAGAGQPTATTYDRGKAVRAGSGTSCYVAAFSVASLQAPPNTGFPDEADEPGQVNVISQGGETVTITTFLAAESMVVAAADNGSVLWSRRHTDGAFIRPGNSEIFGDNVNAAVTRLGEIALGENAQGGVSVVRRVRLQRKYPPRIKSNQSSHISSAHQMLSYDRAGRLQFHQIEQFTEWYSNVSIAPVNNGFLIAFSPSAHNNSENQIVSIDPRGVVRWRRTLGDDDAVAGLGERCDAQGCYGTLVGNRVVDRVPVGENAVLRVLQPVVRFFELDTGADVQEYLLGLPGPVADVAEVPRTGDIKVVICSPECGSNSPTALLNIFAGGPTDFQLVSANPLAVPPFNADLLLNSSGVVMLDDVRNSSEPANSTRYQIRRLLADGGELAPLILTQEKVLETNGLRPARLVERSAGEFVVENDGVLVAFNRDRTHWARRFSDGWVPDTNPAYALIVQANGNILRASTRPMLLDPDGNVISTSQAIGGLDDNPGRSRELTVMPTAAATADGGYWLATSARYIRAPGSESRSQYLLRYDSIGDLLSAYAIPDDLVPVGSIATTEAGGVILASVPWWRYSDSPEPLSHMLVNMSADGEVLWANEYLIPGGVVPSDALGATSDHRYIAASRRQGVAVLPDGGVALAFTSRGVIRGGLEPQGDGRFAQQPLGNNNVAVLRLDPSGNPLWVRVHGALDDERISGLRATADGGLLIAGDSASFDAVTPFTNEAWVLRLGPDGKVADGCNAYLGQIHGGHVNVVSADIRLGAVDSASLTPLAASPAVLEDVTLFERTPELPNTARQCLATARGDGSTPGFPQPNLNTLDVNVVGNGSGIVFSTPNGIFCTLLDSRYCSRQFTQGYLATLSVDRSTLANFQGWGGCPQALTNPDRCLVTMDQDTTVDAFFGVPGASTTELSIEVIGNGRVYSVFSPGIDCLPGATGSPSCVEDYAIRQTERLVIESGEGASFQGWSQDCAALGTAATLDVVMDTDKMCRAQFSGENQPQRFTLQAGILIDGVAPTGTTAQASIRSTPAGIICDLPGSDCSEEFVAGTMVSLAAQSAAGVSFMDWTSTDPTAGCDGETNFVARVTMDQAYDCTARFRNLSSQTYNMTITVLENNRVPIAGGPFGGRVTSSPPGFDCGPANSDCFETFVDGTQVTLTPTPEPGYQFAGWGAGSGSGDCAPGSPAVTTVTVDGNLGCIAMFDTIAGAGNNNVTVAFDAPTTGARVVDVNTGLLDCTAACTVGLPVSQSPIRLRPINQGARWTRWFNCDAVIADPGNPTGPMLCEIGIAAGPRAVTVEFGL